MNLEMNIIKNSKMLSKYLMHINKLGPYQYAVIKKNTQWNMDELDPHLYIK